MIAHHAIYTKCTCGLHVIYGKVALDNVAVHAVRGSACLGEAVHAWSCLIVFGCVWLCLVVFG